MNEKKTPRIRFRGFKDDWERRKLGEMALIIMGQSPNSKNYTNNPNDHILVQGNADLKNEKVVPRVWTTQITKLASVGDLILSVRAPVGDIAKTDFNVVIGRGVSAIKGNEFLFQILKKMNQDNYWRKYSTGSTFDSINSDDIKNAVIANPIKKEQGKIGSILQTLDSLIASNQKKLDNLQTLKKLLMQKIFDQEWRFKGFTDLWERRKLGEVGSVSMNKRIFKDQTSTSGEIPFFKIGTFGKKPDSFISRDLFEKYKKNYPYPQVGDILISASGSIGKTIVYKGEDAYFQDSNIVWLKHNGEIINKFLNQIYSIIKWNGLEGSTIKRLYNKNILSTYIIFPNLREQNKIGDLFDILDSLIASNQQHLDQLKTLKKYLMQNMFV